jgi:transposase
MLRELREYFASSHESEPKIAARIGVSQTTIWAWLAGKQHPAAESVARPGPGKPPGSAQGVEWANKRKSNSSII